VVVFVCVAFEIWRCYSPEPFSLTGSLAKAVYEGLLKMVVSEGV